MVNRLKEIVNQIFCNLHSKTLVSPVQSLLDVDFYKFTMGQFIHRFYPDVEVTFELILRDKSINLWKYVDINELRQSFEYVQSLSLGMTDIFYLRGIDLYDKYLFNEEYLNFLKKLKLSPPSIVKYDGALKITFKGKWCEITFWETIAMAIISELYYRGLMREMNEYDIHSLYSVANARLQKKLLNIKTHPNVRFSDFGHRRRNGFLWHKYVVQESKRVLGPQFVGTSDTWLAFNQDLAPIGTNAHELPMVLTAIAVGDEKKRNAQYEVLAKWQLVYGQGLRIFLPDTYGSEQFFENAPIWLKDWRGQRQDSGVPIEEGKRYMRWLRSHGVDPRERMTIFSDGLDDTSMVKIAHEFDGLHNSSAGWGTLLTNDFRDAVPSVPEYRPFSFVCKVVDANGNPCVKLPNNLEKVTGDRGVIEEYYRIFGRSGRSSQKVIV